MIRQSELTKIAGPIFLLFIMYVAAIMFRPLMPIDETRYMTAAWEMHLRGDWLAPLTVNFEPYHHKPPLLFWMINMGWSIFGISRWAGTLPVLLASIACVLLTQKLTEILFPARPKTSRNVSWLMLGSIPFLIYSLLVMFDITLTVFVLLSLISLLLYAQSGHFKYILLFSLAIGFGVLTKGPVAWLYIIFPVILAPLWMPQEFKKGKWYRACLSGLILSCLPVLLWLIPVLSQSSEKFAYWLVWEQTAGRVTGNFGASHVRPFWFYIPLLPVLFLPWLFFPSFWKGLKNIKNDYKTHWQIRFIVLWVVPVFIAFSLISGKQPHYLVPLLPGALILIAYWLEISFKKIASITLSLVFLFFAGQGVASIVFFPKYDLSPMTDYLQAHREHDWAINTKYHGELTFLGRLDKNIEEETMETIDDWLSKHPNGLAIIRYEDPETVKNYEMLFDMPYRSKHMGVFKAKAP